MLALSLFTIFDDKAAHYLQPFFSRNQSTAAREIKVLANDTEHMFGRHVKDYHLYHVGDFDLTTGLLSALPHPVLVCSLVNLVDPPAPSFLDFDGGQAPAAAAAQ